MINLDDLQAYSTKFLGYGNPRAKLWFVGMEEAGASDALSLERRITLWKERGSCEYEDSVEFKQQLGDAKNFFGENNRIQRTLGFLIRCEIAAYEGRQASLVEVKRYQRQMWGRRNAQSAALELSALPQASLKDWGIPVSMRLGHFESRRAYGEFISTVRVNALVNAIEKYKPAVVICYGASYKEYWNTLRSAVSRTVVEHVVHPQARVPRKKQLFMELGLKFSAVLTA